MLDYALLTERPINREEAEAILSLNDAPQQLLEAASTVRDVYLGKELRFYYPLPRFPNVSVTGTRCALKCEHCEGHYLKGMTSVETPSKLKQFCIDLEARGGIGVLVSGGSDTRGRVPLEKFYGTLRWVKENTNLIMNVHTGLLDSKEAGEIASTGVDIASVDVVGSDETIRKVYGVNSTVSDYWETLTALKEANVPQVIPHICVGLDFGAIRGERTALEMVQNLNPEIIVILELMPTFGTAMERVKPEFDKNIVKVVAAAKLMCPHSSIALGCMRPRAGRSYIEELTLRAGVDRIVLPLDSTVAKAEEQDFTIKHLDGCCSIPRSLEHRVLRQGNIKHLKHVLQSAS